MTTFTLQQLDAIDYLKAMPAESVDLFITDPPYESLEKHRAVGTTTRLKQSKASSNEWFGIFPNARFPALFAEMYRVLKPNRHLYIHCDQETAFIIKPMGEQAGFKFWKPIVWDKCIAPDTPVWTSRGVVRADDVQTGDGVMTPTGKIVDVLATRRTKAPALRIALSDGTRVVASREHRFTRTTGEEIEAHELCAGSEIGSAPTRMSRTRDVFPLDECIDEDDRILEMPDPSTCLFCGRAFDGVRAAAAHQARFCERALSKEAMAKQLGVAPKRLRRWMSDGRLPARWARVLGLEGEATGRVRLALQNDAAHWFPETIPLDYGWGKLVGLFAAEGYRSNAGDVCFALHADEKHLQNHIARTVRQLGLRAKLDFPHGQTCVVHVMSKMFSNLMGAFVGGANAITKFIRPIVYEAPAEFRRGVFDGIVEGDGHWSHDQQREMVNMASRDLTAFVLRFAREQGFEATIRRYENETAGGWRVCFDPKKRAVPLSVVSVEDCGDIDLVDIAIDDPRQLYLLGNGVVSHNCTIGMGYHYRCRYEFVLFFEKGKRRLNDLGVPDVLAFKRVTGKVPPERSSDGLSFCGGRLARPTEKPVALADVLVRQSTIPMSGEVVCDPFCGAGTTGVAAVRADCNFLGNDVSPDALATTHLRLTVQCAVEVNAPERQVEDDAVATDHD